MMSRNNIFRAVAVVASVAAFVPAVASAQWSVPTSAPTAGNVTAPLNVSSTAQSKSGGLLLNTGGAANGLIVQLGNVGIGAASPTYKLQVAGNVGATAYFYTSDSRLKKDIVDLSPAASLANILRLQGVSFSWKSDNTPSVGLIAQDVERVYPELVHTDKTGIKSVEYGNLVGPLVEAIKAEQAEITALEARIAALERAASASSANR